MKILTPSRPLVNKKKTGKLTQLLYKYKCQVNDNLNLVMYEKFDFN